MKIDKDIIESVLANYNEIDSSTRFKIIHDIEKEAIDNKPEKEKLPKKQFVIVALTDQEKIEEIPMYVVQFSLDQNHNDIPEIIKNATVEFNNTPKGRKHPVNTVANAMGDVKRKCFLDRGLSVKTKEPTIIVKTNNDIVFNIED